MQLLIRFIVNAIVLWLIISLIPGFATASTGGASGFGAFGLWTVIILAVIFGLVNMFIGPVLRLISAPITWLTHGLFSVVINWIVFGLAVWWTRGLVADANGWHSWFTTLVGAVILMIVSTLLTMVTAPTTTQAAS